MANMNIAKAHTSPSKASYGRTYDSKLVTREMHRLGTLNPVISQVSSASSISLPSAGPSQTSLAATNNNDPWGALHVHVLPLFNGEPLRIPIEDLNILVRRHISTVVSSSPSKALATLESDASELIASGMVTLNAKLMGVEDDKLIGRVVEIWVFFWDQVLPYVEGVLLPLQTDPLLSSLYRTPKRPTSPTRSTQKGSMSGSVQLSLSPYHIDVRTVALRSLRDKVIFPLSQRLYTRLSMNRQEIFQDSAYQVPRLQQMLLVLTSQARQVSSLSLTSPAPAPTLSENAISDLLRIVRSPRLADSRTALSSIRDPTGQLGRGRSFLADSIPRDRRGRVAQKQTGAVSLTSSVGRHLEVPEDDSGDETPRMIPGSLAELERERERAMLESLKSPDPDTSNARASGGWGLGGGHEEKSKPSEEDEVLNWDQAQALVEKMVGMNSHSPEQSRKR